MAKPNWGKKLKCQSCGAAFYDLNEPKPACPKCETVYAPAAKSRRSAAATPVAVVKKAVVPAASDDDSEDILLDDDDDLDVELAEDDDDEDGLIEDTSDLEDDDDMAGLKDHVEVNLDDAN